MRLFVGNIPFNATEEELKEFFAQAGKVVSVKIVTDRESGRSRGFGFVEMSTEDEGNYAIEHLDGQLFQERTIIVNRAKESNRAPARF